mgnify:CR=1 FL=1
MPASVFSLRDFVSTSTFVFAVLALIEILVAWFAEAVAFSLALSDTFLALAATCSYFFALCKSSGLA